MKKIVHKPAAPIYAAAVVWILYALLFPLYLSLIHILALTRRSSFSTQMPLLNSLAF